MTKHTEIPDDIRLVAKGVLCDLADELEASRARGGPFWSGDAACNIIAEALMQEREQCTAKASGERLEDPQDETDRAYNTAIDHVIDAIRTP